MLELSKILVNRQVKPQTAIAYKWQDRAYQVWKSFNLTRSELPNLFRFFKFNYEKHSGLIEQAYSFTVDYEGQVPKLKLFLWKFNSLKESRS